MMDSIYLTPLARAVPALGKDKKRTDARSAELLLSELLLIVNVNNIRFSDISASREQTNKNYTTRIPNLSGFFYLIYTFFDRYVSQINQKTRRAPMKSSSF